MQTSHAEEEFHGDLVGTGLALHVCGHSIGIVRGWFERSRRPDRR